LVQFDELVVGRGIADVDRDEPMASIVVLASCLFLHLTSSSSPSSSSSSSVVEFHVLEELPPGSYVGNVAADAGFHRKYSPRVAATLRFRVLFQSPPSAAGSPGRAAPAAAAGRALFAVDESSGDVRTLVRIDRERYCRRAGRCVARVDVVVQPAAFFEIVRARIHLLDINDNTPTFPLSLVNHSLPESPPGADASASGGFRVPEADDPDCPAFGVQRYLIESVPDEANDVKAATFRRDYRFSRA